MGQWSDDDPGAALSEATALVAGIVVDQRSEPRPRQMVVAELADAAVQHLAVMGELAEVMNDQVGLLHGDTATAAALRAAVSSAQLFAAELAAQLNRPPEQTIERRSA